MKIPESVTEAVERATQENPTDIVAATTQAFEKVTHLVDYDEFVKSLVWNCIQEMVYDARHKVNVRTKRQIGYYGQEAKVNRTSNGVLRVYNSVYKYHIAGTVLGAIRGEDLPSIAESERSIANGHVFNAELCEWLAEQVPAEKTVEQTFGKKGEKRLREQFDRLYAKYQSAAAQVTTGNL